MQKNLLYVLEIGSCLVQLSLEKKTPASFARDGVCILFWVRNFQHTILCQLMLLIFGQYLQMWCTTLNSTMKVSMRVVRWQTSCETDWEGRVQKYRCCLLRVFKKKRELSPFACLRKLGKIMYCSTYCNSSAMLG